MVGPVRNQYIQQNPRNTSKRSNHSISSSFTAFINEWSHPASKDVMYVTSQISPSNPLGDQLLRDLE